MDLAEEEVAAADVEVLVEEVVAVAVEVLEEEVAAVAVEVLVAVVEEAVAAEEKVILVKLKHFITDVNYM